MPSIAQRLALCANFKFSAMASRAVSAALPHMNFALLRDTRRT
jgi:hypothetical protein